MCACARAKRDLTYGKENYSYPSIPENYSYPSIPEIPEVCVSKETYPYGKRDLLYGKRDLLI